MNSEIDANEISDIRKGVFIIIRDPGEFYEHLGQRLARANKEA
jgi:hypothetical protein